MVAAPKCGWLGVDHVMSSLGVRHIPIEPEERQQIIDLARAGVLYRDISREVGRTMGTIATVTYAARWDGLLTLRPTGRKVRRSQ